MFAVGIVGFVLFVIALNWFVCLILFCMFDVLSCVSYDLFGGLVAVLGCFVGFLFGWVGSLLWFECLCGWVMWLFVSLGMGLLFGCWLLVLSEIGVCLGVIVCWLVVVFCWLALSFWLLFIFMVVGYAVLFVGFELGLISLCLSVDVCCLFWFCFALADFYLCVLAVLVCFI